MCSSVIGGSLFIPYIFSVEFDLLMIRVCTFFRKRKDKKEKEINKKKRIDMFCIWYLASSGTYVIFWGLFIGYMHHWGFMWENKNKERKKNALLCLYMVSCSIGHLCHLLRVVYRVYSSLRVHVRKQKERK